MVSGATAKMQAPSIRESVSAEEWKVRQDLAACYRVIDHYGWTELIFTHLSARVPGPDDHFLINPFGLMFDEITASNLVKVNLKGETIGETEYMVNPAGFVIHGAIHGARADALAVLHIHSVEGVAVAAQTDGLLPISQNALVLIDDVAYHDYEGIALDMEERERLIADMGEKHLLILRNHGLLTVGASVAEAFIRLFFLQRACETQIAAQSGGADLIGQTAAIRKRVGEQGQVGFGPTLADLNWAGVRRQMDRLYPSYKE